MTCFPEEAAGVEGDSVQIRLGGNFASRVSAVVNATE